MESTACVSYLTPEAAQQACLDSPECVGFSAYYPDRLETAEEVQLLSNERTNIFFVRNLSKTWLTVRRVP